MTPVQLRYFINACTKSGKWADMYMLGKDIDLFYSF